MGECHLGAAWLKHGNLKVVVLCATVVAFLASSMMEAVVSMKAVDLNSVGFVQPDL